MSRESQGRGDGGVLEGGGAREATHFVFYSRWDGRGPLERSELRRDRSNLTSQQMTLAAVLIIDEGARVNDQERL